MQLAKSPRLVTGVLLKDTQKVFPREMLLDFSITLFRMIPVVQALWPQLTYLAL